RAEVACPVGGEGHLTALGPLLLRAPQAVEVGPDDRGRVGLPLLRAAAGGAIKDSPADGEGELLLGVCQGGPRGGGGRRGAAGPAAMGRRSSSRRSHSFCWSEVRLWGEGEVATGTHSFQGACTRSWRGRQRAGAVCARPLYRRRVGRFFG